MRLIDADEAYKVLTDYYHTRTPIQQLALKEALARVPIIDAELVVRCKDCRWGREVCGNIECSVDRNLPPEYHGYKWFCPNGERRTNEVN